MNDTTNGIYMPIFVSETSIVWSENLNLYSSILSVRLLLGQSLYPFTGLLSMSLFQMPKFVQGFETHSMWGMCWDLFGTACPSANL